MPATRNTRIKKRLEQMRADLEKELRRRADISIAQEADPIDQLLSQVEREFQLAHLTRSAQRYREIAAALRRIDDGTYGMCLECDEKIPAKRLAAVPWAKYCVACQERAERLAASSGGPWDLDAAA